MNLVWPLEMSSTDKLVLVALADAARNPDDPDRPSQCWPPITGRNGKLGLVERTCLSDRAVQKAVKSLVSAGHITRVERPGHGVTYHIHPRTSFTPNDVRTDLHSATPERGSDKSEPTPKTKTKKAEESTETEVFPPNWLPVDAWQAFAEMRNAIPNAPFTRFARDKIVEKLRGLKDRGEDLEEILTNCAVRGYRDVYDPKKVAARQPKRGSGMRAPAGLAPSRVSHVEKGSGGPPATRGSGEARALGAILRNAGLTRDAQNSDGTNCLPA